MTATAASLEAGGIELDPDLVAIGDMTQRSGFQAGQELLSRPEPPTAIVACNDLMAVGAMSAAQQLGLEIGRDLSVVRIRRHSPWPNTSTRR